MERGEGTPQGWHGRWQVVQGSAAQHIHGCCAGQGTVIGQGKAAGGRAAGAGRGSGSEDLGCVVFPCLLPYVGHAQGAATEPCRLVVTSNPAHGASVRGGKAWGRAQREHRRSQGAGQGPGTKIYSLLPILGAHLPPTPPSSSSLTQVPGGQRLLPRHKQGIIVRVRGVPCAIFHSSLQAEQPSGS